MYRYDICTKLFDKINDNFIHLFQSLYTLYLFLKSCSLYSVRRSNIHNVSPLLLRGIYRSRNQFRNHKQYLKRCIVLEYHRSIM